MSQPDSEALAAGGAPDVLAREEQAPRASARRALREALSATVDGEASELELRRVVNALGVDAELRAEWERAHLIGAAMRGAGTAKPLADGQRPWLRDAADATSPGGRLLRWAWPAAGAAAAAVAALAVVFWFAPSDQPDAAAPAIATAPGGAGGANQFRHLARTPSDLDLRRANTYMLRHVHQTSMSRTGAVPLPAGTVPFVKVLAVQDGRPQRANGAPDTRGPANR